MEVTSIPQVHLIVIDDITPELVYKAILDIRQHCVFGDFTYRFAEVGSLHHAEELMWYWTANGVRNCSHVLFVQWDGFVLDGSLWNPNWLQYDYIGAPWPWHKDGLTVGNGGFSLRSVRLLKFLAENRDEFPVKTPEDDTLCRRYRLELEHRGFVWAPENVAAEFSWERGPRPSKPTFGFHGMFNLPRVLSPEKWRERKALMETNPYVTSKVEWQEVKDL